MSERPVPLIVDLDDTLVRTDTLHEQLVRVAFRRPLRLIGIASALVKGRAGFKRAVADAAEAAVFDPTALPYDQAILDYAAQRRAAGGEVHLVTAADQSIADAVAAHVGVFDTAVGSDGSHNLKGPAKAAAVAARFPDGFAYIGDHHVDMHLWRRAREVLVAGGSPGLHRELAGEGLSTLHHFQRPSAGLAAWLKALRVPRWWRNLLVLAPLIAAGRWDDAGALGRALVGVALFSVVAGATYILNDLGDLAADRGHPTKRSRPLAHGAIPLRVAGPVAAVLLVAGLIGGLALAPAFGAVVAAYAALGLVYSMGLKAIPVVGLATSGVLAALRVVAGAAILGVAVSPWLDGAVFVVFVGLAWLQARPPKATQA